jgi:hypothetical protein
MELLAIEAGRAEELGRRHWPIVLLKVVGKHDHECDLDGMEIRHSNEQT